MQIAKGTPDVPMRSPQVSLKHFHLQPFLLQPEVRDMSLGELKLMGLVESGRATEYEYVRSILTWIDVDGALKSELLDFRLDTWGGKSPIRGVLEQFAGWVYYDSYAEEGYPVPKSGGGAQMRPLWEGYEYFPVGSQEVGGTFLRRSGLWFEEPKVWEIKTILHKGTPTLKSLDPYRVTRVTKDREGRWVLEVLTDDLQTLYEEASEDAERVML